MGRKCSTVFNGVSCRSGYSDNPNKVKVFKFPADKNERERWVKSLPNYIENEQVTDWMGICELHWKAGYATKTVQGSKVRPADPPTEFGSTPTTLKLQSPPDIERHVKKRGILSEERTMRVEELEREKDKITSWEALLSYCKTLDLCVCEGESSLTLYKVAENTFPVTLSYCFEINQSFNVKAYKGSTPVKVSDILQNKSYQHKLTLFSQIRLIIEKLENCPLDLCSEMKAAGTALLELSRESEEDNRDNSKRIEFICHQLIAHSTRLPQGHRYDAHAFSEAMNLFLRSRNAYRALRSLLILPHEKTLRSFFGKFGSAGSKTECRQVVSDIFSKLEGPQKFCYISADEIYVKPSVRFRAGNVIGFAQNQDVPTAARTVLALMLNFLLGSPAFVARFIPVNNLQHKFLLDNVMTLLEIVQSVGGQVFGIITDNLSVNQAAYKLLREKYTPDTIYSVSHPFSDEVFSSFYHLYDPTHLLKNIRNNWVTEKCQTLEFFDPDSQTTIWAKWSDIIQIYKIEEANLVKMTNLNYASLFPNNFEKQKVQLVVNVFNEKTVSALELRGKKETALFVKQVTRMWHILNIKSSTAGTRLNDEDRMPFYNANDPRLTFLEEMATSFKKMDSCKRGKRVRCLTQETSNALHVTLHGIVNITRQLLAAGLEYVLPGKIQSDRLEGEFGIYRQSAGGDYFISVEQVLSSLSMQRLKLYHKLEIVQSCDESLSSCCSNQVNDDDLDLVDLCFTESSNLSQEERSALYYICGYVAFKEKLGTHIATSSSVSSEFLELVSRGKLTHPPPQLYDMSLYFYTFFKLREKKCCEVIFIEAYKMIYESTDYDFQNVNNIVRRISNCFFKGFVKQESDKIRNIKDKKSLKKRKLVNM